jgi:hypothetical protein
MSFLNSDALARSREGVFRALATWLEGDVQFSTDFPFALRDTLPAMVVLGHDWFAFCRQAELESEGCGLNLCCSCLFSRIFLFLLPPSLSKYPKVKFMM